MGTECSIDMGLRIKELRRALDKTRAELAESLSISVSHLANLENGNRSITVELLGEMHAYYGVSADYILFGKGEMFVENDNTYKSIFTMNDEQKMHLMLELYEYFVRYKSIVMDDHEVEIHEYFHEADRNLMLCFYNQFSSHTKIYDKR